MGRLLYNHHTIPNIYCVILQSHRTAIVYSPASTCLFICLFHFNYQQTAVVYSTSTVNKQLLFIPLQLSTNSSWLCIIPPLTTCNPTTHRRPCYHRHWRLTSAMKTTWRLPWRPRDVCHGDHVTSAMETTRRLPWRPRDDCRPR